MNRKYIDTVRILLSIAPIVFASGRFAMKGGTALNLFVQNMPRLSVDIDLVYIDHRSERTAALNWIGSELASMRIKLKKLGYDSHLVSTPDGYQQKLVVKHGTSQVKIEVNLVFRGTVLPVRMSHLVEPAQLLFTTDLISPILATPELYGSKLVAAMDRQHPRDFYDLSHLAQDSIWDTTMMHCFVAYVAGHNRPIHEVLFPTTKNIQTLYTSEFTGMTRETIKIEELMIIQSRILEELPKHLTENHKEFLLSLVKKQPRWECIPIPHMRDLPAIKWKLMNLEILKKNNHRRFEQQYEQLATRFK